MNRSNGYRSPRMIFSSELKRISTSNDINEYLNGGAIEVMDINDISSTKTMKSSTLNRHQVNKPKSPGIEKIFDENFIIFCI